MECATQNPLETFICTLTTAVTFFFLFPRRAGCEVLIRVPIAQGCSSYGMSLWFQYSHYKNCHPTPVS